MRRWEVRGTAAEALVTGAGLMALTQDGKSEGGDLARALSCQLDMKSGPDYLSLWEKEDKACNSLEERESLTNVTYPKGQKETKSE